MSYVKTVENRWRTWSALQEGAMFMRDGHEKENVIMVVAREQNTWNGKRQGSCRNEDGKAAPYERKARVQI